MKLRSLYIKTTAAVGLGLMSMGSQAALQTLFGDTINYVFDDQQAAIAQFGTPTNSGDIVIFFPENFRAESLDGAGTDQLASTFVFDRVYSVNDNAIMGLYVGEDGDYGINGSTGEVSVDLRLTGATNPGGGTVGSGNSLSSFNDSGDSGGIQNWELEGYLDVTAFETPNLPWDPTGPAGPQTDIKVSIQNTVTATTTGLEDDAWIQKKLTFTAVSEVPVPAAAWLFGSAMMGLVAVGRRRRVS